MAETARLLEEIPPSDDHAVSFGKHPPPDKYNVAWLLFGILGLGVLFPWNAFLTAYDFFEHLYPDFPFDFALSLAYNYPSIFLMILSVKFGERVSFGKRIISSYIVFLGVLLAVPFIGLFLPSRISLWLVLACVFLTGCSAAIVFGSVLSLAALFPGRYIAAVMAGQGLAGLVVSALRIITKVSLPATNKGVEISSAIYFGIAAFIMLVCIVSYFVLLRLPFTKFYLAKHVQQQQAQQQTVKTYGSVNEDDESFYDSKGNLLSSRQLSNSSLSQQQRRHSVGRKQVFWKMWREAAVVFSVFFVTLSLFPGIISLIQTTTHSSTFTQAWFQIVLISLFMIGDLIGRSLPRWVLLFKPHTLWIPTVLRFSFFALFILCIHPKVFHHDAFPYTFMLLFAISNGYCGTLSMMYGPVSVDVHEKEIAGTMMSFFLNFGIFVGAHFAVLCRYLVTGSVGIKF